MKEKGEVAAVPHSAADLERLGDTLNLINLTAAEQLVCCATKNRAIEKNLYGWEQC